MFDETVIMQPECKQPCNCCCSQHRMSMVVCIVTCVFAFSCCIYCTWIIKSSCCDKCSEDAISSQEVARIQNPSSGLPYVKTLIYERIKRSADKKKVRRGGRKSKARAAHYKAEVSAHFINKHIPGYQQSKLIDPCAHIGQLDGKLCRDGSYTPNGDILNIFTKAPWVSSKRSPFKQLRNGIFEARYTGIYFIYGQLLTVDDADSRNVTLTQSREAKDQIVEVQKVTCYESNEIRKSSRFKTCAITALFDVRKKDNFLLQDFGSNSKLNLREGTNYFGAVVLK